jgi:PD-(D/E)XK endonuclease
MNRPSSHPRTWSDAQLVDAVKASSSWRGVMRELGLNTTSAGAIRIVRRHAVRLGLDFSHLGSGTSTATQPCALKPDLTHLREAGASIAAAWFTLCGCTALFPVEPATYDLVVPMPEGLSRIQVKTTTSTGKNGWQVTVSRRPYSPGNLAPRVPYDPEVIDYFFIIDGDLNLYLIPSKMIAGRIGLLLRTYKEFIVGNASGLFGEAVGSGSGTAKIAVRASA